MPFAKIQDGMPSRLRKGSSRGRMWRGATQILGRNRPWDLLDRDPILNEAAELRPRNDNMQCAHAPMPPLHFSFSIVTMPQQHFNVLVFDVVGAPIDGDR